MRSRSALTAAGVLSLCARALCAQTSPNPDSTDLAARTQLKSDLRNLVVAQESYYSTHNAYADVIGNLTYAPSAGSHVSLVATMNNAWAAVATDPSLPGKSCVIYINLEEKYRPRTLQEKRTGTNADEGRALCDGDPKPDR